MQINKLTGTVVNLCIKIHNRVGPGYFERVYKEILYNEWCKVGLHVRRQVLLPMQYDELFIENAYILDLLVENRLVLELKPVYPLPAVNFNQMRTQLSWLELKHGC